MKNDLTKTLLKEIKPNSEVYLINKVREILDKAGLMDKLEYYDTNHYITDNINKRMELQRLSLNQFWTIQLLNLETETTENLTTSVERYGLIGSGSSYDWIVSFIKDVLPTIIKYRLPSKLQ